MRLYATKKDFDNLNESLKTLATVILDLARWQAYYNIKENPLQFNESQRQEILKHSKGHLTHGLFKVLFRAYPLKIV
jgi:hypothetical protein